MISIVSGISGQAGSYLAELLLSKNERVVGFSRRTASHSTHRIDHLMSNPNFTYLEGDVADPSFIWGLISQYKPAYFYNLAAQSHVHTSFSNPYTTFDMDTKGVLNVLDAIRTLSHNTRFCQASTSEMFGSNYSSFDHEKYQDEDTPFKPQSPYAIAKLAAHHLVRLYRESYNLMACSAIMFNYESPRRGENFVTQKIIKWVASFERSGFSEAHLKLNLGNLDAFRDWSHCKDTMNAVHLLINQDKMDDYVVGTGETYSVRNFLSEAFFLVGISDWSPHVMIDSSLIRPAEVPYLKSKPDKIKSLGWKPEYSFKSLVKEMLDEERLR